MHAPDNNAVGVADHSEKQKACTAACWSCNEDQVESGITELWPAHCRNL